MPTLPQFTAEGRPGITSTPMTSPDSFGAQAGAGLQALGQSFQIIDKKLKDQRDKIELSRMASEYAIQSDALKAKVLQEPDYTKHAAMFQEGEQQIREKIADTSPSKDVSTAFEAHSNITYGSNQVALAGESRRIEAEKQLVDYQTQSEDMVDRAALATSPEEANSIRAVQEDLTSSMVKNGLLHPAKAQLAREQMNDRYWQQRARRNPQDILKLYADKTPIAGMDNEKLGNYLNIAMSELGRIDKQQNTEIKGLQEGNQARFTEQAIKGELDRGTLASVIAERGLDPDKAAGLIELNLKMQKQQGLDKILPQRTGQIETRLRGMKFDPDVTPEKMDQFRQLIFDEFTKDHISKEDFQHLNGVWQSAQDWLHSEGRSNQNRAVSHAHEVLQDSLRVVGPLAFDALGQQTMRNAAEYFYREMDKDPKQNAMDVAVKAEKIFKPVLAERQKLGQNDQDKLDDAKMSALRQSGALSEAAYKDWKGGMESKKGQRIVDNFLSTLPPEEETGWFDRFMSRFKSTPSGQKKERK